MNNSILKLSFLLAVFFAVGTRVYCQNDMPDVFKQESIPEQLKYLEEHTRIYENFRAVREDIFQKISKNTIDTLSKSTHKINSLIIRNTVLNNRIDSLRKAQESFNLELKEVTRTKESISVLGLEINKKTYNTFMWTLTAALIALLLIGYFTFRQNRMITLRTKKDLNELMDEYEKYKKKTRLEREKMTIDHFNEIKKLRGS
jgi:DNA mismatch repair ATPase MutS